MKRPRAGRGWGVGSTAVAPGVDYVAEALLPCAVEDAAREQSFRNGVLELRWPRTETKT